MKARFWKSLLCAFVPGFAVFSADAATSLFSDYGQIQNVQNYSSNPFWTPNAPYNQRLPQPVYVQGADLNTEDCIKVVQSLVSVQCMARDNCKNVALGDIRPAIMVQLSNLPGKNYVSSCSGYIDGVFESYVAQFGGNTPNRAVAFPGATVPNTSANGDNNGVQLYNPYQIQTPEWKQDIIDRSQELKRLQNQNGANNNHLSATAFPTTYADLSFSERMQNTADGYAPYKDMKAYKIPDFKNAEEWCSEHGDSPDCMAYKQQLANCTDYAKTRVGANDAKLIVYAERKSNVCEVVQCKNGYTPDTSKIKCTKGGNNNGGSGGNGDGGNGGNGDGGNGGDGDTPINDPDDADGLCLNYKKFDLSATASIMFKDIQVHTPDVAKKLAEEYVKCSNNPDLTVSSNYTQKSNQDFFDILNTDGTLAHKVEFDDVTESNGSTFGMDTITALCAISNGTLSNRRCPNNTPACFQTCTGISQTQFDKISALIQSLVGATGQKFEGWGKWCYKITYDKNSKNIDYTVYQQTNCVNEILQK